MYNMYSSRYAGYMHVLLITANGSSVQPTLKVVMLQVVFYNYNCKPHPAAVNLEHHNNEFSCVCIYIKWIPLH